MSFATKVLEALKTQLTLADAVKELAKAKQVTDERLREMEKEMQEMRIQLARHDERWHLLREMAAARIAQKGPSLPPGAAE